MHFLLTAALTSGLAAAHDADVATLALQPTDAGWVLDVHFPLEAAERGLGRPGDDGTWDLGDKANLVQHIRETVKLEADGAPLHLGLGGVKLGGHQSTVRLGIEGAPEAWTTLAIDAPMFSDNPHQHNIVRVMRADDSQAHFVAKAANGYRGRIGQTADAEAEEEAEALAPGHDHRGPIGLAVGLVPLGLLGAWGVRRRMEARIQAD
jgi:hypothetical protein